MKKKPHGNTGKDSPAAGNVNGKNACDGNPEEVAVAMPEKEMPETDLQSSPKFDAEERLAAFNEKYLRLLAEYDNFRKRTTREMECVMDIVSEKLLAQLLPILDNLDRATEHRNDKTTFEEYIKGITLIEDQLRNVLAQAGLKRMEVIGRKFDPAVHCAVFQQESKDHEPGTVIAEAEKGYTLQGKIIRHPKVVVSK